MAPVRFTFFWTAEERWEGQNYNVEVQRNGSALNRDSH